MIRTRIVSGLAAALALVAFGCPPTLAERQPSAAGESPPAAKEKAEETEKGQGADHVAGEAHVGHGAASDNPLAFAEDLAIWTVVVFLLLLAILWKFAWGPIVQGLDKREKGIADQISQADESNREAKQLLARYEQKLADSRDEVRGLLEKGRRDADELGQELIEQAQQEADSQRQRSLREIDAAAANAVKELAGKSAEMAVDLAGRILGRQIDADDHTTLIERAVGEFAQKPK